MKNTSIQDEYEIDHKKSSSQEKFSTYWRLMLVGWFPTPLLFFFLAMLFNTDSCTIDLKLHSWLTSNYEVCRLV